MNTSRIAFLCLVLFLGPLSRATESRTAEQVVRAYAATWNAGDQPGFYALLDPDIHKFARDAATSEFRLTTSGLDGVKQKYAPLFAKPSRVKVEIMSLTTLGEIVVTRDQSTNTDEDYVADEMTMYQVHDGRIVNIWYLGRETNAAH
jgi:hypothetical protein